MNTEQEDKKTFELFTHTDSEQKKLMSDRDLIHTIKDLILMKHFTYNKDIIKGLDLVIWQFIIDHLKERK